jgi:hypothetical protein
MRRAVLLLPAFLAAALAAALPAAPAAAGPQPVAFADAPIGCGEGTAFSDCRASFDGWTLTIVHLTADKRSSEAVYRQCTALGDLLRCGAGEWRSGKLKGALPPRMIGLREGKPFPR